MGCDVESDADGALWVTHTGENLIDRLEARLIEVTTAFNERYPCDSFEGSQSDEAHESKVEEVVDLLDEVKGLYNVKYCPAHVENVECHDGASAVRSDGPGLARQSTKIEELEGLLEHVKALFDERFPLEVHED